MEMEINPFPKYGAPRGSVYIVFALPKMFLALPHTFRHSFVHMLRMLGTPTEIIAKMVGHSSIQTTDRVYSRFVSQNQACVLCSAMPTPRRLGPLRAVLRPCMRTCGAASSLPPFHCSVGPSHRRAWITPSLTHRVNHRLHTKSLDKAGAKQRRGVDLRDQWKAVVRRINCPYEFSDREWQGLT